MHWSSFSDINQVAKATQNKRIVRHYSVLAVKSIKSSKWRQVAVFQKTLEFLSMIIISSRLWVDKLIVLLQVLYMSITQHGQAVYISCAMGNAKYWLFGHYFAWRMITGVAIGRQSYSLSPKHILPNHVSPDPECGLEPVKDSRRLFDQFRAQFVNCLPLRCNFPITDTQCFFKF